MGRYLYSPKCDSVGNNIRSLLRSNKRSLQPAAHTVKFICHCILTAQESLDALFAEHTILRSHYYPQCCFCLIKLIHIDEKKTIQIQLGVPFTAKVNAVRIIRLQTRRQNQTAKGGLTISLRTD